MIASNPHTYFVVILGLTLASPVVAQDLDSVAQVNKILSRDPTAAISAARELLKDEALTQLDRAKLMHLWGRGLTMTQDFRGALSKLEEAKQLATEIDNQRLVIRILQAESVAHCERGDFHRGADAARAGIEIADSIGDELVLGILQAELGTNLHGLSDYEDAITAFNAALDVARKLEKQKLQALALANLASIYDELEHHTRATELHREALQFFENSKNNYLIASAKVNLANSLLNQELVDQAESLFQETLELAAQLELLNILGATHLGLGDIALYRNNIEQAKREYQLAGDCWQQRRDPTGKLTLVERSARIAKLEHPDLETDDETIQELEKAVPSALSAGNKKLAIAIAEHLVAANEMRQRWEPALRLTKQIAELNEQIWSRENKALLAEAESRALVLEKEKQIQQLNYTNQLQKLELLNQKSARTFYLVALGFSIVVIGIIWRLSAIRRNAYQELRHVHAEQRRQEQRQIELERKLADQNKTDSLRIMAGGIAHDFNNLMTGIIGQAEVGRLECESDAMREHFDQIIEVAMQASGLTIQLTNFAGRSIKRFRSVNLEPVHDSTIGLLKSIANPVAEITLLPADKKLPVIGDETQLQQVLVNLVKNASEAIEHSGQITISSGRTNLTAFDLSRMALASENGPGEFCYLKVEDNGSGLEPSLLSKIFDPFFSTKFVGRGLGLASVLGIIRSHRGAILVESQVNVGTTITIYLPLATQIETQKAAAASSKAASIDEALATQFGVMFVDDDPLVRQSTTSVLAAFGFEVFAAENAIDALEIVERNRDQIRVAVIDFAMNGKNGIWLAEQLRTQAPEIKRILCSAYTEDEIRKTDLFVSFLSKPYFAIDLVDLIKRSGSSQEQLLDETLEAKG